MIYVCNAMADVQRLPEDFEGRILLAGSLRRVGLIVVWITPVLFGGCGSSSESGAGDAQVSPPPSAMLLDPQEVFRRPLLGADGRAVASTRKPEAARPVTEQPSLDDPESALKDPALAEFAAMRKEAAKASGEDEPTDPIDAKPTKGVAKAAESNAESWTIVLAAWREADQVEKAKAALPKIREVRGLEDAYITTRGAATFIGFGKFVDPSDPAARERLADVRNALVGTDRPFADAFLAPPEKSGASGGRPEFSLASAKEQYGKNARMTLAIGVYRSGDGPVLPAEREEGRKLAEQAVAQLRREGELAFYYHGQRESIVCIGVFSEKDIASNVQRESERLAAARKRFPHNLVNGLLVKQRIGGSERITPSTLVQIPEK